MISKPISDGDRYRPGLIACLFLGIIKLYRLLLSPIVAQFSGCRFYPTCSQYGLDAIEKYGAWHGGIMTIKRILRCNPFFPGGYDPVE
jgi:putative membrane protein insertion efficiency factor